MKDWGVWTGALMLLLSQTGTMPQEEEHRFSNRLAQESSPYLLLHAHNPVDWFPWGDEAIEKARREDKPIFLSVGYSTCYWCHVMEREVFSNPEIAALMNTGFVNIKVDREERPDIDDIYMTATQLIRGSGGWPNSVFLTAELKPFFAGTYFPPQDRDGMVGFPTVLERIRQVWLERREEVEQSAERLAEAMRELIAERREPAPAVPPKTVTDGIVEQLGLRFDEEHGGFGAAPKFPSAADLYLLWDRAQGNDERARDMVLTTLRQMGRGAIYDQLDGGFHRYTVDAAWRVPHFEKMLYDSALLAELYALAAHAESDPELEKWARGTLEFWLGNMRVDGGGFKSAIDAETDGEEGAYYVWTSEELRRVLGETGFSLLAPIYGFDGAPNFENHKYTLYLTASIVDHAARLGTTPEELVRKMEPHLDRLRRSRRDRPHPLVDDKVLADWNGMMISALSQTAHLLQEPRYLDAAREAAQFVLRALRGSNGILLHTWREGEARIPAFLDDYTYLTRGLLHLHRATGETRWLEEAERLTEEMEERLRDRQGGYFLSAPQAHLLFQPKNVLDGAIPSANGIATLNFVKLAELTGKEVYRERAQDALRSFAGHLETYAAGTRTLALALDQYHRGSSAPTGASPNRTPAAARVPSLRQLAEEVVTASARWAGPDAEGWRPFRVQLQMRPGWHVNANPASMAFLIPTHLKGAIRNTIYPDGEKLKLGFAEDVLSVYSGEVAFEGEARLDSESVLLVYQACDDERCLSPVEKQLILSVPP